MFNGSVVFLGSERGVSESVSNKIGRDAYNVNWNIEKYYRQFEGHATSSATMVASLEFSIQ